MRRIAGPRGILPLLLGLALLPCVAFLALELELLGGELGFPLDDSFIHLQFARNLAAGDGLTYNPGERVTGSTAPLWTALLSLVFLLPGDPLAWAKALAVACHLAAVAATWALARRLVAGVALPALAAALAASTGALVWSALAAMEVPAFCALSLLGMARHVDERRHRERLPLALPLLALAVLLRPEGILLPALAVLDRLLVLRREGEALRLQRPSWRPLLAGLLLAAVALVPTLLVYDAIGGSPLPTTFGTKGGSRVPGLPAMGYLVQVLGVLLRAQAGALLLAAAGSLALLARTGDEAGGERRDAGLLPVLWLLALPLAYGVLTGSGRGILGNFGRYFFPLLPVIAVLAVAALPLLAPLPPRLQLGGVVVRWRPALAALLLAPGLAALALTGPLYRHNLHDIDAGDVRLARVLARVAPPQAVIAVNDIGAVKYLLPNRVVDLAGIATPAVHAYARRARAAGGSYCAGVIDFVRAARPDYLAVFPRWLPCLDGREFPLLLRLEVPGNVTLGDDQIVLHATPWTRYRLRAPTVPAAPPVTGDAPGATPGTTR